MKRRELLVPTAWGWLLLLAIGASLFLLGARRIHPYLAVQEPRGGELLVVEGWLSGDALREAIGAFRRGNYRLLVTTGGPLDPSSPLAHYHTHAELAVEQLRNLGFDPALLRAVAAPKVERHRTHASALALRSWIDREQPAVRAIDLCSEGVHTRRTWLVYRRVFEGSGRAVGAISVRPEAYDTERWWRSSAGVKMVVFEATAYLYELLAPEPELESSTIR